MVGLNCETDFVALTPDFKALAHQLADLVLADGSLTDVEKLATAVSVNLEQPDTVQDAIQALIGKLGENIQLGHAARYTATETSIVHGYVHAGAIDGYGQNEGRLGVLVELSIGDKPMVSKQTSHTIAHDLALHIASATPKYVSMADIPAEVVAQQTEQLWAEVADENKPDAIKAKMVAGRLNKFYQQTCLLEQPFLKDDSLSVAEWLIAKGDEVETAVSTRSGQAVSVLNFIRVAIDA
jgi:elongation factor Ts